MSQVVVVCVSSQSRFSTDDTACWRQPRDDQKGGRTNNHVKIHREYETSRPQVDGVEANENENLKETIICIMQLKT